MTGCQTKCGSTSSSIPFDALPSPRAGKDANFTYFTSMAVLSCRAHKRVRQIVALREDSP